MKDVLQSKRFSHGWLLLSREELPATERLAALDGVRRLLAARGHDLDSLLAHAAIGFEAAERERAAAEEAKRAPTEAERFRSAMRREEERSREPAAPTFSDMGDIFSSAAVSSPRRSRLDTLAERIAEERRSKLRSVAGAEVPTIVTGTVSGSERMTLRGTTMLSFRIENPLVVYGPMFASDLAEIEAIEAAERHNSRIRIETTRHPERPDIPIVGRVKLSQ